MHLGSIVSQAMFLALQGGPVVSQERQLFSVFSKQKQEVTRLTLTM